MKLISWRSSLAAGHVLLAVGLLIVGHFQERAHRIEMEQGVRTGWELRTEWDYMPRARIWLLAIDSPPSLLSLPFIALVAKFRLASQLVFLLAVGFFWYWIGNLLEKRANLALIPAPVKVGEGSRWIQVVGLLGCVTLLGIGVRGFFTGGLPIIIHLSDIMWSFILGFYFTKQLTNGRSAAAATA
jgi:hypothetical protein